MVVRVEAFCLCLCKMQTCVQVCFRMCWCVSMYIYAISLLDLAQSNIPNHSKNTFNKSRADFVCLLSLSAASSCMACAAVAERGEAGGVTFNKTFRSAGKSMSRTGSKDQSSFEVSNDSGGWQWGPLCEICTPPPCSLPCCHPQP